jgi:hypothetical protein
MSRIAGVSSGAGFDMDNPGGGLYPGFGSNQPYIGQALLNPLNKKKDDEPNPWDLVKGTQPGGDTGSGSTEGFGANFNTGKEIAKTALDITSMVPGLGAISSIANASISALEGDWSGVATNAASAIPFAGTGIKGLKLGSRFGKLGQKFGRIGGIFKGSGG